MFDRQSRNGGSPPATGREETLKYAHGRPAGQGRIKAAPEDFLVSEQLGFEPEGSGQHLLLRVRKRDANTEWVARRLARLAGVSPRDIGFAGLKDRRSVSEQWFSLGLPDGAPDPDFTSCEDEFQVIAITRHSRKLKRGGLKTNHFKIRVTELDGDEDELQRRLDSVRTVGVPNYFGPQRFGIEGSNLRVALAMFADGEHVKHRSRRAFAYSAARAFLFNMVLSRRVDEGNWDQLLPGDVANLDGTRSTFVVEELHPELQARLDSMDVHPTGPLWGAGRSQARGQVLHLEQRECGTHPLAQGLERCKLSAARRSLRLPVRELDWSLRPGVLTISFRLPAGGYATSVLREILRVEIPTRSRSLE